MIPRLLLLGTLFITLAWGERISRYDVALTLKPSGELHVDETIAYSLALKQKHGIFRDIPTTIKYQNKGRALDIGIHNVTITMDDNRVNWVEESWNSPNSGEIKRLKIGDAQIWLNGTHRYAIGYDIHKIILPYSENRDTLRWNIIGTHWEVPIDDVFIDVHLPNPLSKHNVKIKSFRGGYGSTLEAIKSENITWHSAQHFSFELQHFQAHEGATLEIIFPQGILARSGTDTIREPLLAQLWRYLQIPLLLLFMLYLFSKAKRLGLKGFFNRSYPPHYYPPEGLTIMQASTLLNGRSDPKDIFPALLEMAQQGYITIYHDEKKPYIKKNTMVDQTLLSHDQKKLLKALFPKDSDTYHFSSIYSEVRELNQDTQTNVKKEYFQVDSSKKKGYFGLALFGGVFFFWALSCCVTEVLYGGATAMLSTLWVIVIPALLYAFLMSIGSGSWIGIILSTLALLSFGNMALNLFDQGMWYELYITPIFSISFLLPFLGWLIPNLLPLNDKGLEYYTQLIGFKKFIEKVDRDRLELFLEQDPSYMDRILPYATLFDLNDHWIELSQELLNEEYQPDWYQGAAITTLSILSTTLNAQMQRPISYSSSSSSSASSYSSGGFSGGGSYSGGGGGGGGGGSW